MVQFFFKRPVVNIVNDREASLMTLGIPTAVNYCCFHYPPNGACYRLSAGHGHGIIIWTMAIGEWPLQYYEPVLHLHIWSYRGMHAIYNDTDVNPAWSVKEKNLNSREYDRSSSYRPLAQLPLSYGLRKQKWQGFRLLNARLSHHGWG